MLLQLTVYMIQNRGNGPQPRGDPVLVSCNNNIRVTTAYKKQKVRKPISTKSVNVQD